MEKTNGTTDIKERLSGFRDLYREYKMLADQYDTLCNRMYSIGGNAMTGMPHNPSPSFDKIAIDISLKEETLERLTQKKEEYVSERTELLRLISMVKNPDEKQVLLSRYIYNGEWPEVAKIVYGRKKDFNVRYDDYLKYTYRKHSMAVASLSLITKANQ